MKTAWVITTINFLILLFLAFRLGVPFVNETASILTSTDSIGVFLAAQANQFALMQIMLSILGIGIAIAAFWGYFEIKRIAKNKAEETIKAHLPKTFEELMKKIDSEDIAKLLVDAKRTIDQKNGDSVFQEGITRMHQDPLEGTYEE